MSPLELTLTGAEGPEQALTRFEWTRTAVAFADVVGPALLEGLRREAPVSRSSDPRRPPGGRARDSIRYERSTRIGGVTLAFTSNVPYMGFILKGHLAPAEPITPSDGVDALLWYSPGGDQHFAKSSPGGSAPPNDFPARVWAVMGAGVVRGFRAAVASTMKG